MDEINSLPLVIGFTDKVAEDADAADVNEKVSLALACVRAWSSVFVSRQGESGAERDFRAVLP